MNCIKTHSCTCVFTHNFDEYLSQIKYLSKIFSHSRITWVFDFISFVKLTVKLLLLFTRTLVQTLCELTCFPLPLFNDDICGDLNWNFTNANSRCRSIFFEALKKQEKILQHKRIGRLGFVLFIFHLIWWFCVDFINLIETLASINWIRAYQI